MSFKLKYILFEIVIWRHPYLSQFHTGLENRKLLVRFPARQIFVSRINDSHCDMVHSSLTVVHVFDYCYVRKQPVAWKEYM